MQSGVSVESKSKFDPYGVQPHVVNYPGFHPGLFEVKPAGLPVAARVLIAGPNFMRR